MTQSAGTRHGDPTEPPALRLVIGAIGEMDLPPFDPLNLRASELRAQGHHVISLGQALPFFTPPAAALTAARAALESPHVHRYSTDPGLPSLRRALAERLGSAIGDRLDPSELVITAGANHAFTLAITTLTAPGDEVVLPAPYFTNHQMAVVARGAVPVEAPVADREAFTIRWSDIETALSSRTRAVVLCTPSNPTGATIDRREGSLIVSELARRGIAVISDETYMLFVHEGEPWSAGAAPRWRDNVVVIGSFSKSFGMMGWRVGYLLADAALCAQVVKVQDAMIICAPVISQMAVEGAVRDAWTYASSFGDELRRRRQVMAGGIAAIPRLRWTPARGGLFAFARVAGCDDSAGLAADLIERAHIVTIPGSAFGSSGEGCLRLSYGYADPADLDDALRRLRDYFASS